MRFVGTHRASPVANGVDLPHKHDLLHIPFQIVPKSRNDVIDFVNSKNIVIDTRWWKEQRRRCLEGYTIENFIEPGGDNYRDGIEAFWSANGKDCYLKEFDYTIKNRTVHLTGRHYFYLNFWWIKAMDVEKQRKMVMHPKFTDLSWENWLVRDLAMRQKKDHMDAKARQKGLSEEEAADTAYDYIFWRDSQTVIVSGEEKYSVNTMRFFLRGMERLRNTQFYLFPAKGGDSIEYTRSEKRGSEVYCRTAKDNAQALSSLSPTKILYEEIGIWKKGMVSETSEFVKASTEAEGIKSGRHKYQGTGGEIEEGVADMEDMLYKPDEYNLWSAPNIHEKQPTDDKIARFIPSWKFRIIDSDGNSLREKSLASLHAEAATRKNTQRATRFWTQNPIYPHQIFAITSGTYFPDATIKCMSDRAAEIIAHRDQQVEKVGILEPINPRNPREGVRFIPQEGGWFHMIEEPDKDEHGNVYINLYKSATDSYDQDESNTSSSKGSWSCYKGFNHFKPFGTHKKFVARITERPSSEEGGSELFYYHTALGCIYYGMAINLIEFSKWRIIDWYKDNNFTNLLKERPRMIQAAMIDDSKATNRYGIDPSTKHGWLALLKDALTPDFINNMDDVEQLRALARFKLHPKYNCDITISTALCIVLEKDEDMLQVMTKKKDSDKKNSKVLGYKMLNGQIVRAS